MWWYHTGRRCDGSVECHLIVLGVDKICGGITRAEDAMGA